MISDLLQPLLDLTGLELMPFLGFVIVIVLVISLFRR